MKFETFIASRYLNFRKRGFISLITLISILGVFLGTCVLTVALSIANGMENEVRDRITGTFANARVQKVGSAVIKDYEELAKIVSAHPDVAAISPTIMGKGTIEYANIQEGVQIMSVNDSLEKLTTDLHKRMISGEFSLDTGISNKKRELPEIIIGSGIANKFAIGVGHELVLMSLINDYESGDPTPVWERFVISGVFSTGMYEYDQNLVFISLEAGKKLFEIDGVEMISFRSKNIYRAGIAASEIVESLGGYPYKYSDWESQNHSLFQWMRLEKLIVSIIIMIIVLVAAFNITSTLVMMIMEKRKEIGILRSMGARRLSIMRVFLLSGGLIGIIGSVSGTVLGCVICFIQQKYRVITLPEDVYIINFVPILMEFFDIAIIFVAANLICLFAAFYPAWRASNLLPAEAIRFE
ncbi:MAG: ABC transporter permease [Chitinivibrionia bacterium]|nr:ABC transporter permease [Chitinivibrionia bacterium]